MASLTRPGARNLDSLAGPPVLTPHRQDVVVIHLAVSRDVEPRVSDALPDRPDDELYVAEGDRTVKVERVVAAVDCGTVVNPDIVRAQVESAVVYGLTAALHGEITIDKGRVVQSNFHDYPLLRMSEMPVVEVHLVPSTEPPTGIGEPGTPPIAPAVANAVYALTRQRIRRLPIRAVPV